ncbi:O-antigen ligase domain-containing protein [Euzebyella marina]|uniref:O-antigen ligase domain-containing protein n=1 Tax=Euzebyella marina TaxID=1761453 RepID=A0A3G2L333_9FLAO|nr:O-antigen ligase family protein [Euzebyella marina]AYN66680.1 O-antigen ligase domain-containing protein [Euzebyella marina]
MILQTNSLKIIQVRDHSSPTWLLTLSIILMTLFGCLTDATYPVFVNIVALATLIILFIFWLEREDYTSFLIQLVIGNFFIFGAKYGGNFNISASLAILVVYLAKGKFTTLGPSSLKSSLLKVLFLWWLLQLLGVWAGNEFPLTFKVQSILAFSLLLYLFYFTSKINLTANKLTTIFIALTLFFYYLFLVSVNQRYIFINYDLPFLPLNPDNVDYELGIIRSSATLGNFEAYAEFCVSFIAILFPSFISGSLYAQSKKLYVLVLIAMPISVYSMVLTATRSSMLLLPFILLTALVILGRRVKTLVLFRFSMFILILLLLNSTFHVIDFSVFLERSKSIDFERLTISKLISGEEMNRGDVFDYAWNEVKEANTLIGRGYFSTIDEYRSNHFPVDNIGDGIADYHNIYLSSYVLWGSVGSFCLTILFFYAIYNGLVTYWKFKEHGSFVVDLILGFTIMFSFFLVNQLKIQFIRDVNYFMLVLLLLAIFISAIKIMKTNNYT